MLKGHYLNRDDKNREHHHVLAVVAKKGETNEEVMTFIMDKTLEQIIVDKKCIYCVDGAPSHMHASVCKLMRKRGAPLYVSPPNSTMWAQACDKHEVTKKMNIEVEELFAPWVIEKTNKLRDTEAILHPSHAQFGKWVSERRRAISDNALHSSMRKAIFPNVLKLGQWRILISRSTIRQMQSSTLILILIMTVALIMRASHFR